jgi:glyoxylase-like metal-dependent hydrolase (beta-lactamase superfamily II)
LGLAIVVASLWYFVLGDNSPIVEGQLVPGVETVKDGFVSVFVLDAGPGSVALVDAGKDASGAAILRALGRRGLTRDAVRAVFLTHGHGDHTAGCRVFPSAAIYAFESDAEILGDTAKITNPLKDGDIINIGDLRVETFAVPGHTPGSAAFLARGVLFFGDSAGVSTNGELVKAVRIFTKDPAQNVASLRALEARLLPRVSEIKVLAFAHSGALTTFQSLVAFANRHP